MALKPEEETEESGAELYINRTFMALKRSSSAGVCVLYAILIVPLWH
jgi:hypothetical protein